MSSKKNIPGYQIQMKTRLRKEIAAFKLSLSIVKVQHPLWQLEKAIDYCKELEFGSRTDADYD